MSKFEDSEVGAGVRATIKEFARAIPAGISPAMREIEVAIAVERLREEHGIEVDPDRLARLAP